MSSSACSPLALLPLLSSVLGGMTQLAAAGGCMQQQLPR
jgi:hypothetical protein